MRQMVVAAAPLAAAVAGILVACDDVADDSDPFDELIVCDRASTQTGGPGSWMLAAYTLPDGDASPDVDVDYTMTFPSDRGALRSAQPDSGGAHTSSAYVPSSYWQARLAFESARRAQINGLVDDLRAGRRSMNSARSRTLCEPCDESTMCWNGACVAEVTLKFFVGETNVVAELVGVVDAGGTPVNVLLDTSVASAATRRQVLDTVVEFGKTSALMYNLLGIDGHSGPLDRDSDGRMTVVFSNETGGSNLYASTVGFFSYFDFLPPSHPDSTQNEMDLLWVRVPGTTDSVLDVGGEITQTLAVGTMVHEYSHLVSYAVRVQARKDDALPETLWLDEGYAHLMEDLTGWGPSNIGVVAQTLTFWTKGTLAWSTDTVEQRGKAYLLLRHLIDARAKAAGADDATSEEVIDAARDVVSSLLNETTFGLDHSVFRSAGPRGFGQWLTGVYASGNSDVELEAAHAYDYLPPGQSPVTGHMMGINPFETYEDARGQSVLLEGAEVFDELDDSTDTETGTMPLSGSVFYDVIGVEGLVVSAEDDTSTYRVHTVCEQIQ